MKPHAWTILAGASLVCTASFGLFLSGVPSSFCPMPALTVLPAFMLGNLYWLAVMIPAALFFLVNPQLLRGASQIPIRSLVAVAVLVNLSAGYFWALWQDGVQYQGASHLHFMCTANAVWVAALAVVLLRRRTDSSFMTNLLFHWLLFAWLSWYAFPYLGELP
jgi:hypothetical protein